MGNIYKAHIFKQRQVGPREEVKLRLFSMDDEPIDLCGGGEGDPSPDESEVPYTPDISSLEEHVSSETPHPVYDDGPSFTLLYENAKV